MRERTVGPAWPSPVKRAPMGAIRHVFVCCLIALITSGGDSVTVPLLRRRFFHYPLAHNG